MKQKVAAILITILSAAMLSGCKEVQIFEEYVDPNAQVELMDSDLQKDTYYVKNGTNFTAVYLPDGTTNGTSGAVDYSRLLWFFDEIGNEALVPEHYKDEIVAYASNTASLSSVSLERFKDLGYSLGIYGGTLEDDGYYHLVLSANAIPESNFYKVISQANSGEIRIKLINDQPLSADMVDPGTGVILGLEANKTYKISFFSGTYYYEANVTADAHYLQSYEIYNYGEEYISDTKRGYRRFETPDDLKSGWYNVNGQGLFKYYDFARGEKDLADVDMNVPFYNSEDEMIAAHSIQKSLTLETKTKDLRIAISYDDTNMSDMDKGMIAGNVYAPDGTHYTMSRDDENKTLMLVLKEAMAGKWTIHIMPRTIEILDIVADADKTEAEMTLYEKEITFSEDMQNRMFCVEYQGDSSVNATLISPDGQTYILEPLKDNKEDSKLLGYSLPYVSAGTYRVRVYYYAGETQIKDIYEMSSSENDTEVIVIEG